MTHLFRRWRTALRVLAIALIVAAIPLPSLAQQPGQAAQPRLQASIAPVVHAVAVNAPKATATKEQQQSDPKAQLGSKSFFKTPLGMTALAIVFAGCGFAIYSASHDRIHSVVRQGQ